MINLRKWSLMAFGIIALSGLVFYPVSSSTYAKGLDDNKNENSNDDNSSDIRDDNNDDRGIPRPPQVKSSKFKRQKCKTENTFRTRGDVYAEGEHFSPLTTVHVFVTPNKQWRNKQPIGADVSSDGENQVQTDFEGKFSCTEIWANPLQRGSFDIVVDANCDGTFDPAVDAVDGRGRERGFRVR